MLSKFRGKLWVDKADYEWVKLDLELIDSVSFGLFLARIAKGAHLTIEQTRLNDEVWLPLHLRFSASATLGLVKKLNVEQDTTFKNFRKFQTDCQVVR